MWLHIIFTTSPKYFFQNSDLSQMLNQTIQKPGIKEKMLCWSFLSSYLTLWCTYVLSVHTITKSKAVLVPDTGCFTQLHSAETIQLNSTQNRTYCTHPLYRTGLNCTHRAQSELRRGIWREIAPELVLYKKQHFVIICCSIPAYKTIILATKYHPTLFCQLMGAI